MARSTYIYIVEEHWDDGHRIVAAFTVKHELVTWLTRNTGRDFRVIRVNDGISSVERITQMDIKELLA